MTDRPPASEETAGGTVGPYVLRRCLGEGGCGVVWLAEQTSPLRRLVALKVIKPGMDTRSVIARFESERQALALMNHPNIARVYDAGATPHGRPYFAMEYVEGVPITRFCDEHSLPMPRRLELFAEVCLALQHAHQKGIVHRDLKPSNILVAMHDGKPTPKVIDFGIAKATETRLTDATLQTELGVFLGTPAYMSPEQADRTDADIDTRSDVYSLGTLLYELLTGRPPYDPRELVRAGLFEIRRIIREVDPPRPSTVISTLTHADREAIARLRGEPPLRLTAALRGDLDWIVMRCLEKDRDRRYPTAVALAEDVRRHLRQEPVEARPPQTLYRIRKFVARHRLACASATALALALIGGAVASTWQAVRARRAEHVAAAERDAANLARNDAQRRQGQAEDLLAFMIGDFRAELQKIGRLDPLDAVGEKALAYFAALDPRDLSDSALMRQAKVLTQLGEVRMEQARYPEARQAFLAAYARAAALVTRHPKNGDMIFERGQAEFWIGFVARRRGDGPGEREWLTRYRDTALELAAAEGRTPRAQLELVYGHHNLAALDLDAGRLVAAEDGFRSEMESLDAMLANQPADKELLLRRADTWSWLGSVAERDARYGEAANRYAEMRRAYEELAELEPDTARWRFERAQSLTFVARIALIRGDPVQAQQAMAEASALLNALTELDSANKRWSATKLSLELMRAGTAAESIDRLAVEDAIVTTRQKLEALLKTEPSSRNFARLLVVALTLEARFRLEEDNSAEAGGLIDHARRVGRALLEATSADDWTRHDVAQALITAGRVAHVRGERESALSAWSEALSVVGPAFAESRDWRILEPAAVAATLAERPESSGLVERLKAFGYHPADPFTTVTLGLAD